jgi:hypothetical protein
MNVFLKNMIFIKKIKMAKIIRLTESELVRLVKKVISEKKKMLSESATVNGTKVDVLGGGLSTTAKGVNQKYSINVKCGKNVLGAFVSVYTGPISLSSLWDGKDGGIGGKDNTGKVFSIPSGKAKSLVQQMISGDSVIKTEGEGTIAGITGSCYVILKKK